MPSQLWSRSGDAWDPSECEDGPGHEWAPAGGGLLICINCEDEKWADEDDHQPEDPEFGFGGPAGVLSDRDVDPGAYA